MRGHIGKKKSAKTKSGYRYYPVVFMGFDINGKKKYKWHPGHDTKTAAQTALNKILHDLDNGTYVEPSKEKLYQFMHRWLESRKKSLRYKTYTRYEQLIRNQINPHIGNVRLSDLRAPHLEELYAKLSGGPDSLSNRSILHVHRLLHTALERAVAWDLITRNVADNVDAPKAKQYEAQIWSPDQALFFLNETERSEPRYWIAFALAILTGLRQEEILGLKWSDVDWEHEIMQISRSMNYRKLTPEGKRVPVFEDVKTHRSKRPIQLSSVTIDVLKQHRSWQVQERLRCENGYNSRDMIVAGPTGEPMNQDTLRHAWQRALRNTKVPRIRFHDLRHTHSSLMMALGADLKSMQERMGHATPQILLNTYTHTLPGQQRRNAERLDDLIFGQKQ